MWLPLVLLGCPKPVPPAVAAPERPALVVLIVVDQLPVRLLELPKARYTGGLARLTGDAAAVRTAGYAHAITYTCPGHATISTGASPSEHGIVSNDWYFAGDPGTEVYCSDASFLRVGTLADRVVEAGGRVASVALKDRAAVMLGGKNPSLVSWFDRKEADFTGPLAGAVDVARWMSQEWTALFPDDYARWVGPDDNPLESDPGLGTLFPHPPATAKTFLYTPFSGGALAEAALAATEKLELGAAGRPDLLTLSFSQTDYIGHAFTAESWEAVDGMIRLDREIGWLIDALEQRLGAGRVSVLLTSDHGAFEAARVERIGQTAVQDAANAALAAAGFAGEVHFESPSIWLPHALSADPEARARAAIAVADAVRAIPGIAGAYAWRVAPPEGPHADAVRASLDPERSGDVYVLRGEGALYDYPGSEGRGTSHGTPFSEDTDVPFLAWGVGIQAGAGDRVDVRQVAPTVARLLGVPAPDGAKLPPVDAMLR